MSENVSALTVQILKKDYRIACTEEERGALLAAARSVDEKMREIRDTGRIIGLDRIAVMAALQIAHELMQAQPENQLLTKEFPLRLARLNERLDSALNALEAS